MVNESRLQKTVRNLVTGIGSRVLTVFTAFIVRTVFLHYLNNDYLSVNGLYSSVLSMLSLAELGFSTAMVYSMYRPLADKDYSKLTQIMRLYRQVYAVIGTVILVLGLCVVPFLDVIIRNKPDIRGLTFYYLVFLFDTVLSYWFFAYRSSILQADQKAYIISSYNSIFSLIKSLLQIVLLVVFHNYTIYLLTQVFCTIAQNIAIALYVKKYYPVFAPKKNEELPSSERKKIFNDVKALMLQKVSFRVLNTSDSIIISSFVGLSWVGLLSNYLLIIDAIVAVLSQIMGAISASMGNYFAKEEKEMGYVLFKRIEFMNYWLYAFCAVALLTLLNPFISLWLGKDYLLERSVVVALVIRFFVEGYMNTMSTFRSTLGLFTQGKYLPLVVAGLNICFSIILSSPFGVSGVLIATPLARACINVWYMPLIIHRDGFDKPVKPFYFSYLYRILLLVIVSFLMLIISSSVFVNGVTIARFAIVVVFTIVIPNILFVFFFHGREEFVYFSHLFVSRVVNRLVKR